jgi:thiamine-monophosphate kinase
MNSSLRLTNHPPAGQRNLKRKSSSRVAYSRCVATERIKNEEPDRELGLLGQLRRRASSGIAPGARNGLRLGIGDDCALLRLRPGEELAVTTDLSLAGRHFRLDWHPPESIGHRTLARGLSDLAAMGARPVAAFLSLGLPRELALPGSRRGSITWMSRFLDGLLSLARAAQAPLAGGDLAESPLAVADIVLAGAVPQGKALLRSGARPGDLLYVTGKIGGAAQALEMLRNLAEKAIDPPKPIKAGGSGAPPRPLAIPRRLQPLLAPHLYPQPRVAQGIWLRQRGLATAAIDLSDGISTDLAHLCDESGVAAEIDQATLPIHPAATLAQALDGGEDYELLFTARPSARLPRSIAGVEITRIGKIARRSPSKPKVALIGSQGARPLDPHGWEHFS